MFTLLLFAFVYVMFKGLSQPDMESSLPGALVAQGEYSDIAPGETGLRKVGRMTVWVTRVDSQLLEQMELVSGSVTGAGCAAELGLCFLSAATSMDGILISQADKAPPQLASSIPWFGGFVDPTNGAVFDRFGRAYKAPTAAKSMTVLAFE